MMPRINMPDENTYYILVGEVTHYGCVAPTQVMNSNIENITIFNDEAAWIAALLVLGITLDEEPI